MSKRKALSNGFSMIELTIVVVIIAIIAAIAIPKMSRGASGANDSAALQDLSTMRAAIDLYTTEHGGTAPPAATFTAVLTSKTDVSGNTGGSSTTTIYGPYLKSFPTMPVGTNKGSAAISTSGGVGTGTAGWYYDGTTIWINDPSSDTDVRGAQYNAY